MTSDLGDIFNFIYFLCANKMKRRRDDNASFVDLPYEKRRRGLGYMPWPRVKGSYVGYKRDVTSFAQQLARLPEEILRQIYRLSANFGQLMGGAEDTVLRSPTYVPFQGWRNRGLVYAMPSWFGDVRRVQAEYSFTPRTVWQYDGIQFDTLQGVDGYVDSPWFQYRNP